MDSNVLNGWKEIGDYLKATEKTAARWGKKKRLPFAKVCGSILSTKGAIDRWIEEGE